MKFSPIHPLRKFYKLMGWSRSTGERRRRTDPDFPPLIQIGVIRHGVREADAAKYQVILQKRAELAPRNKANPFDVERARAAARISATRRTAASLAKREAKQKQPTAPAATAEAA
jgi:hypothetical protein